VNFTESFARPIGIIHRKGKIFSGAASKFIEMLTEDQQPTRDSQAERTIQVGHQL
jgi:hypothetical protein